MKRRKKKIKKYYIKDFYVKQINKKKKKKILYNFTNLTIYNIFYYQVNNRIVTSYIIHE